MRNKKFTGRIKTPIAVFLAQCSLVSAFRSQDRLWRGLPVVLGVTIDRKDDLFAYEEALPYLVDRKAAGHPFADMSYSADLLVLTADSRSGKVKLDEVLQTLRFYDRVVMLLVEGEAFPEEFHLAADCIVKASPITARHIAAAVKSCLLQDMTVEEANGFAGVTLDKIDLLLRKGRTPSEALRRLSSVAHPSTTGWKGPLISELSGMGEAVEWARDLAIDIADWRSGKLQWTDVDRGVLLSGPPGTGKTTFAASLAQSCKVPLIVGSAARWQAKGHLGDMLAAMRKCFADATAVAPSILFLDEIDAIGNRDSFSGHNAQYNLEVVAALLECMDGLDSREGVVIVGACNKAKRIDPALLRPGRFDRQIEVPLPDAAARLCILYWHLAGALAKEALTALAERTDGWSGAALEQLVRQGRRSARRMQQQLTPHHLMSLLPPLTQLSPETMRRIAAHECGHVVVARELGFVDVAGVTIATAIDESKPDTQSAGTTHYIVRDTFQGTREHCLAEICRSLAGLAAEAIIHGSKSTASGGVVGSDLYRATLVAARLEASYGMGSGIGFLSTSEEPDILASLRLDAELRRRTERLLEDQYNRARQIIENRRADVERLAEALFDRGSLTATDIDAILTAPSANAIMQCTSITVKSLKQRPDPH